METMNRENTIQFRAANQPSSPICHRCGHSGHSPRTVSMAFWQGVGLFVIQDIPVMACDVCHDECLADETILGLDRMRGEGLTADQMVKALIVPVYQFPADSRG
jgi:YgiT-type zinc finger domain-containing protein